MEQQTLISAFLVGLLGGVHCVSMCGGIVAALSLGVNPSQTSKPQIAWLLAYNFARITSYTLIGGLFGWLGASVIDLVAVHHGQQVLQTISGVFMILLGLYLANWWRVLVRLEGIGTLFWIFIEPIGRRFIPIKNIPQAFYLGLVWGWLPCGLVYTVAIWSLSSGSTLQGGVLMLAFGLGTLPNLMLLGIFASSLRNFMQQVWVKTLAGVMVMGLGVYQVYMATLGDSKF